MRRAPRPKPPPSNSRHRQDFEKGPVTGPFCFLAQGRQAARFVVGTIPIDYIAAMVSKARRIILADHARLPWRFFGRLTAVQAGL